MRARVPPSPRRFGATRGYGTRRTAARRLRARSVLMMPRGPRHGSALHVLVVANALWVMLCTGKCAYRAYSDHNSALTRPAPGGPRHRAAGRLPRVGALRRSAKRRPARSIDSMPWRPVLPGPSRRGSSAVRHGVQVIELRAAPGGRPPRASHHPNPAFPSLRPH
jgi:hypothetical protein